MDDNKDNNYSFFTLMFKGLAWKEALTSFKGLLAIIKEVKFRFSLYNEIMQEDHYVPEDLLEQDFDSVYGLDDELYDYGYYKGWTETIPMFLIFFMFLTGSYSLALIVITWCFDEVWYYYNNEFHADNVDENEPPEIDEYDSPVYEASFLFYDIHNKEDYDLLYYNYINRFRKSYYF